MFLAQSNWIWMNQRKSSQQIHLFFQDTEEFYKYTIKFNCLRLSIYMSVERAWNFIYIHKSAYSLLLLSCPPNTWNIKLIARPFACRAQANKKKKGDDDDDNVNEDGDVRMNNTNENITKAKKIHEPNLLEK